MNALQQKCRPKHQVLVLRCYPRTTKGAVDVRPNSSELSYLLFYATSRRSKIQKIGAFLEKKTASDVWRMRIGNVQVTLGILAAVVEKSPKDLALIAPCIFKVLDLILRSNDITMIESSLPTFQAFCEHHDASTLFADHAYLQQYRVIVAAYAQLASSRHVPAKGTTVSRPVQMRWRNAGLDAIKCVSSSAALSSVFGRQIDVIVPVILDNMSTADDDIEALLSRLQAEERVDAGRAMHRRMSVATVKTNDTAGDTNPLALSGTALEVDKMDEQGLGVLAMQCLKSIFVVHNRTQIHAATMAMLQFISHRSSRGEPVVTREEGAACDSGWAIDVYDVVARWAPVQDRYVILLAALDTMFKTPLTDADLGLHLTLTGMIQSLLRSDINLIGLSVMDVVLGLAGQIKKLIRTRAGAHDGSSQSEDKTDAESSGPSVRVQRRRLIERLEQCIGDLATHVYYGDQVSDMVVALIGRLKPGRSSSATSLPLGEDVDGGNEGSNPSAVDLSGNQSSSPFTDVDLAYGSLRASALRIIKAILVVANPKTSMGGTKDLSRNRVPMTVWEGTQWLLREPDGPVRKAYVDALLTWLDRETTAADATARDEFLPVTHHRPSTRSASREPSQARRAVSNASNRERQSRAGRRSQFLPLLHLAVYDSAHQFVDFDSDMALLHALLARLVAKLGVNAARYGIPMIYRLQEDVQYVEDPVHKVRMAALCHGYFWALTQRFDLEGTVGGRAIQNEIARRKSKGFWVDSLRVPPLPLDGIGTPGQAGPQPSWELRALEKEELLPFDDRASLVHCIAASYRESRLSPPASPVASPGRGQHAVTVPLLGYSMATGPEESRELPVALREGMLSDWSRDSAVAALSDSKAASLNGSRTGTTGTANQKRLTVYSAGLNGGASPMGSANNLRLQTPGERVSGASRPRNASVQSGISPTASVSSRGGIASVEQLKMVLTGNASPRGAGIPGVGEDDSDESMVSFDEDEDDESRSEHSSVFKGGDGLGRMVSKTVSRTGSSKGPLTSHPLLDGEGGDDGDDDGDADGGVPPVPPLPKLPPLSLSGRAVQDYGGRRSVSSTTTRARTGSREGGASMGSSRGMDLQELLRGIDSRASEGSLGNATKPPY
ncbi:hypothetical protein L249_3924 [Ophiocordyceps polyrhachis-furcata BCC 54312]|uniref:Protein EFR3 n=1 Tax=Ophiocordyceps polyrhachis-furcata BCC 54312 TaxID=1330021 RepID=A0A367L516_9HYPO|nr:hypothetical protein L249_3924 [Ophiocordyceps polyrhachis-furcata BCC 54312]